MELVFGKCNLSCREGSQERYFRGSQQVQSVNTALSCDSVCRSWPANSYVVIGLSLHLYSSATCCFIAPGVAASSQWTGRWTACFCSHPAPILPACLPWLSLCIKSSAVVAAGARRIGSASWFDEKLAFPKLNMNLASRRRAEPIHVVIARCPCPLQGRGWESTAGCGKKVWE